MPTTTRLIACAFALALAAPCAAGDTITLPLDLESVPLYLRPSDSGYPLAFDAGRPLEDVVGVRLHVTGLVGARTSWCWNFGGFGGGVWTYPEQVGLAMGFVDTEGTICLRDHVFARPETTETFDAVLDFGCGDTPDWSFLAGGVGTVQLQGLACAHNPSYPEVCNCDQSATLFSATLVIETETSVPNQGTSWGALKARYR
jgi:hypothetical protein